MLFAGNVFSQQTFTCVVKDAGTRETLAGVTAKITGTTKATASDENGNIRFTGLPAREITVVFSFIGYADQTIKFSLPQAEAEVLLQRDEAKTEEAVIISSSRTNSRIEDLPTRVEVIGSEEMDEEASTMPGNIASLPGDIAGIQNQRTSETSASLELRVQGLPGKYTQILRDGLPLFSGYGGGFSLLQIPPLDLKQVEIIKGASSTLYGGGAIAGMINLISKTPRLGKPEHSILVNYSTLNEFNLNTFHSGRNKKTGYTFFAGTTQQRGVDVNKDGFSDVPDLSALFLHPKLFWYPTAKNTFTLEYDGVFENREGGDMQVIHKGADNLHRFFIRNKTARNSIAASWKHHLNSTDELNFKGEISFYKREITTDVFGMKASQPSWFTEFSYLKKMKKHVLVAGLNYSGERFRHHLPDSSGILPYSNYTVGLFVQDDWKISPQLTAETGLRFDYGNPYDPVLLPRLSLMYKFDRHFTSRLGGGMGYKIPSVFNSDVDERELRDHNLLPGIRTERSLGANWDVGYKGSINEWNFTINQLFFFTQINRPLIRDNNGSDFNYINAAKPLNTKGFETYVAIRHDELEVYLGYTYTISRQLYNPAQPYVPLSAKSKFATVISNEFTPHFRACAEFSYTGRQYLDDGTRVPAYPIAAGMVRYDIGKFSLVLNCENIFDYRQTRKENILYGSISNPSFRQIWGPVDGRVANLSVRFSW